MDHFTGYVSSAPRTETENGEETMIFTFVTTHTVVVPQGFYFEVAERIAKRGEMIQVIGTSTITDEGNSLINAALISEPDTHTSEPIANYSDPSGDYIVSRSRDADRDQLETMIFNDKFLVDAYGQDLTRAPEFDDDLSGETKITERFHSCVDRSLVWIDGKAHKTGNPDQF